MKNLSRPLKALLLARTIASGGAHAATRRSGRSHGPDEPDRLLGGREDRHHLGAPLNLGADALLDVVGAYPVAVSRG